MQDATDWLAWRNSSLFEASEAQITSGESSLEVSPENGPTLPELRTIQNLSIPVQPELLSQQLNSLLQWHISATSQSSQDSRPDFTAPFPAFDNNTSDLQGQLQSPSSLPLDLPTSLEQSGDSTIKALSPSSLGTSLTLPAPDTPSASEGAPSKRRGSTSNSSLTATDKRARNTEASKRFRANRKAREEESKRRLTKLTDENESLHERISSLERENALLRSLITGLGVPATNSPQARNSG